MTATEIRPSDCLSLVLSGVAANEDEARAILHRKRVMDRLTREAVAGPHGYGECADRSICRKPGHDR